MKAIKPKQSQCPHCGGAGGYYWDAPVYHNERQREWASCRHCVSDRAYAKYLRDFSLDKDGGY